MVRQTLGVLLLVLAIEGWAQNGQSFQAHFEANTLRFDFIIGGNFETISILPVQMKKESGWAGPLSLNHPTDNYGTLRFRLYGLEGEIPVYQRGFTSLFQEWQATPEASDGFRGFYQSLYVPFPRENMRLTIDERTVDGTFRVIFETSIQPDDYFIIREIPGLPDYILMHEGGESANAVDLVFLAEGYTIEERTKFLEDARSMTDYLFSVSPFSENRDHFNVGALFVASRESGTDIPHRGNYADTRFSSTFSTFGMDRYLTVSNMREVYDALSGVLWDTFFVLVNSEEYGGGGFYNFMGIGTARHPLSKKVFIHELGHSFAGLADEYYTSHVAFEFPLHPNVEPWETNITIRVDFESKWSSLIDQDMPIPTPRIPQYENRTGLFEGGGYREKGIFSPAMDCRMKSNNADEFCQVCRLSIQRMIDRYRSVGN